MYQRHFNRRSPTRASPGQVRADRRQSGVVRRVGGARGRCLGAAAAGAASRGCGTRGDNRAAGAAQAGATPMESGMLLSGPTVEFAQINNRG